MSIVNINTTISAAGTSLLGYMPDDTKYNDLVTVFGEPTSEGDGYKVDAEWVGGIDSNIFTIYNYKSGVNYNGSEGTPVEDIRRWHIGGFKRKTVSLLIEYFEIQMLKHVSAEGEGILKLPQEGEII